MTGSPQRRDPRPLPKKLLSPVAKGGSGVLRFGAGILANSSIALDWLRLKYLDFVPRPDDVFIVTYPRSGTTWLQMILYQMTTDGEMNFTHISEVVPWFEQSTLHRRNIEALPSPRAFKTHLHYNGIFSIPKAPCRYIYMVRNGKDVLVSYYHFYKSHLGYKGTFPEFFERFMRGKVQYGSWFKHVAQWRANPRRLNVLYLRYEDLLRDPEGGMREIADFCGFDIPTEKWPVILERTSFAFMKQYELKFDPAIEVLWQLHETRVGAFLRKGKSGYAKEYLTPEQEAKFDQAFEKWLGGTGLTFETPAPAAPANPTAPAGSAGSKSG
ncbi:MAG: sulfotransferase domain-containing protein [Chloroflexi bacterium]|nr:MAG: sulfotransferase domain-containing protein [Chloroflexota bacterium]